MSTLLRTNGLEKRFAGLRALGYGRYEFTLSDHKPVWALFEAPVKTIDWTRAAATESSVRQTLTR